MNLRTPKDIGLAIRERRRALGLGQEELARRVGVSRQWIIEAEKGKARAGLGLILRTLGALGIALWTHDADGSGPPTAIPGPAVDPADVIKAHRGRSNP